MATPESDQIEIEIKMEEETVSPEEKDEVLTVRVGSSVGEPEPEANPPVLQNNGSSGIANPAAMKSRKPDSPGIKQSAFSRASSAGIYVSADPGVSGTYCISRVPSEAPAPISEYLRSLVSYVLLFTQRPYNFLQHKVENYRSRLVNQSFSVMFHSASPLSILLHRPAIAMLFVAISAVMIFFAAAAMLRKESTAVGSVFRFTPLELRSGSLDVVQPHVEDIIIYQESDEGDERCLEEESKSQQYVDEMHLYMKFDRDVRMDAFAVVTGGEVKDDPVRFTVSVQRGDGEWEDVGFHRDVVVFSGQRRPGRAAAMPEGRGDLLIQDLRSSRDWKWYTGRAGGSLGMAVGLLVAGVCGLLNAVQSVGRPLLYLGWALGSAAMATAAGAYLAEGSVEEGAMWAVYAVVVGTGTGVLWWRESVLLYMLPVLGLALVSADVLCHASMLPEGWGAATVSGSHGVLGGCMLVGGLVLWVLFAAQHRAVSKLLATDFAIYSQAWRGVVAREQAALERLDRWVTAACPHPGPVQQCHRIVVQDGKGVGNDGQEHGHVWMRMIWWMRNAWSTLLFDMSHESVTLLPIRNIDQLYAQAVCANPILRSKVKGWARRSGGMFRTDDGEFVRWDEAGEQSVVWGQLKKEGRAIEKVIRCYGEDASRLVDVCRQTIVFGTVKELADCLKLMVEDSEVEIVRVKNRMRPTDDAEASAGLRNVSLNLYATSEQARSFGVNTHVCEVQLTLLDFAKLQHVAGRQERYLLFRDHDRPVRRQALECFGWMLDRIAGAWKAVDDPTGLTEQLRGRLATEGPEVERRRGRWLSTASSEDGSQTHMPRPDELEEWTEAPSRPSSAPAGLGVGTPRNAALARFSIHRLTSHSTRHLPTLPAANVNDDLAAVGDDMLRAFERLIFRRNTTHNRPGGQLLDFWAAMEAVSASSVFFLRHPVEGALTKRLWRVVLVVGGMIGLGFTTIVLLNFFVSHSFQIFRFRALGNRAAPDVPPMNVSYGALGVSARRCPVLQRAQSVKEEGATVTLQYFAPTFMDSIWLRTSPDGHPDDDPTRFLVEGSNNGESWTIVCGSGHVDSPIAGFRWTDANDGGLTTDRNAIHVLGPFGMFWRLHNLPLLTPFPFFLSVCIAAIRAELGDLHSMRILICGCFLSALSLAVVGSWTATEFADMGKWQALHSGILGIIAVTLLFRQRWIFAAIAVAMAYGLTIQSIQSKTFPHAIAFISYMELAVLCICVLIVIIRFNILRASRRMVAGDKQNYDKLWAVVVADQFDSLERLEDITSRLQRQGAAAPRHCYSSELLAGVTSVAPFRSTKRLPVRDLDQIFAQAVCLHPMLLCKVQEWAAGSGGMFRTEQGQYIRWSEAGPEVRVVWGQLKKEGRAIEKVIRCYGEDASRLVDVCRQTIVFDTAGELADCLQLMADDNNIEIVRVKNRMRLHEDAEASAGFRNVSINLRVTGGHARRFGVDTHVCEVQLLLHNFAKLQKSQGHKRYVRFRNVRGE